jgi:uncharacterized membrane protein (TIGR02234 family)
VRPRGRLACAVAALAAAGLVVLAAGRPWVTASPRDVPGVHEVSAAGSQAAPAASALALAAAAAAVALLVTGRFGRRLAALVLALGGAGVVAAAVAVLVAPADAVTAAVTTATGRAGGPVPDAAVTAWVAVALAAGLVLLAAGSFALLRARAWPSPARRFDTSGPAARSGTGPAPGSGPSDDVGAWDALSRGEDPTA